MYALTTQEMEARLGKEIEILLDYHYDPAVKGVLAANGQDVSLPTSTPTTPGSTNGSLGPDEFVEVLARESDAPFDPSTGVMNYLQQDYLILDNKADSRDWLYMSGRADMNVTPFMHENYEGHKMTFFGGGVLEAVRILDEGPQPGEDRLDLMGRAVLAAAVPRAGTSVIQVVRAGPVSVTGGFHRRYWGHRFTKEEINTRFKGRVLGGKIRIRRPWAKNGVGMWVELEIPEVPIDSEHWTRIFGGTAQDKPGVWPFLRWAIQAQPTSGRASDYPFSQNQSGVSNVDPTDPYQNLDFNFASGTSAQGVVNDILLVDGFDVRPLLVSADVAQTDLTITGNFPGTGTGYIRIVKDTPGEYHPNNGLPVTVQDNPNLAGLVYPTFAAATPHRYRNLHRPAARGLAIARARGYVAFQDDQVVVPAHQVGAMISGHLIENYTATKVG